MLVSKQKVGLHRAFKHIFDILIACSDIQLEYQIQKLCHACEWRGQYIQ